MLRLSPNTQRGITLIFAPEDRLAAEQLLVGECGNNLPLSSTDNEYQLERIRFAAIKASGGTLNGLSQAISLAKTDWRDLLMSADFGDDPRAHEHWFSDLSGREE
jgi:hypothetical protein